MKFILNGCDISFIAEAPDDITLKQLIQQTDKIKPDWCACGICSLEYAGYPENTEAEISITYNDIKKNDNSIPCSLIKKEQEDGS